MGHGPGGEVSTKRPQIHLILETEPGWSGTVESRVKRALKVLLRAFGLKCVYLRGEELPKEQENADPDRTA